MIRGILSLGIIWFARWIQDFLETDDAKSANFAVATLAFHSLLFEANRTILPKLHLERPESQTLIWVEEVARVMIAAEAAERLLNN